MYMLKKLGVKGSLTSFGESVLKKEDEYDGDVMAR